VLIGGALKRRERSDPDADDEIRQKTLSSLGVFTAEESATAFCIRVGSGEGVRIDALLRNIRGG
jgi:hypothetical protein